MLHVKSFDFVQRIFSDTPANRAPEARNHIQILATYDKQSVTIRNKLYSLPKLFF